jgi:NAD(P)-dependent dehydrogenase (short-subunit alcohol dehydrogenase family)
MKLDSSVCIVTGGATGVGAACVRMLAGKGARVVINWSRSEAEAEATLTDCITAGGEAIAVQGDVSSDADCRRIVASAVERWGRIDGLVNNAGITKFADPFDLDSIEAADFHRLLDVNVIGAFQMSRAVARAMRAQGQGAIVNVSSNATAIGGGSSIAYTASKGALNAMTLTLARVLGPEIRVNAVSPGVIDSRWLKDGLGDDVFAKVRDRYADVATLARVASPEDIADPVVWLLEGADFITGEILMVDGGVRLGAGLGKPAPKSRS